MRSTENVKEIHWTVFAMYRYHLNIDSYANASQAGWSWQSSLIILDHPDTPPPAINPILSRVNKLSGSAENCFLLPLHHPYHILSQPGSTYLIVGVHLCPITTSLTPNSDAIWIFLQRFSQSCFSLTLTRVDIRLSRSHNSWYSIAISSVRWSISTPRSLSDYPSMRPFTVPYY